MNEMTGTEADLEQEERALEARNRPAGDFEPVAENVAETMAALARAKEAFDRKRLRVFEQDCPRCDVADAPLARQCAFLGQQICRHAQELERRARKRTIEANLRAGKVPETHWPAILSGDIDDFVAVAAARRVLAGELNLLILAGTPDSGKSFAAALAVAERGGFFTPAEAFDRFADKGEMPEFLHHCRHVGLLALDDVGAGRSGSSIAAPQIEGMICHRFDRGRPTIVTTNLVDKREDRSGFWDLYGGDCGRVANRAGHSGWVTCVERARRRNSR